MNTLRRVIDSRLKVLFGLAAITLLALVPLAQADAAPRSKGTMFVFDTPDCTGGGNSPKVTVPFSVGGRDYPPNTSMSAFATDMNTGERFGPFVVTTNGNGDFCQLVRRARPTQWKIDLVEPGSGFTDSKVITVLPPAPGPTTTQAPTTTSPATTTTAGSTTTGTGVTTTAVTTTTSAVTTTEPATSTSVDVEVEPPIELVPVPVPPEWSLPSTGAESMTPAAWGTAFLAVGCVLIVLTRRRGTAPR